jgi:hypothetical protein
MSRSFVVTVAGCVGAFVGFFVGAKAPDSVVPPFAGSVESQPLPHQVPKYPGGTSLRLAMVHDVLHERFARHGRAYYEARNRQVRRELAEAAARPPEQLLPLFDDLGAGLDYLGQDDEAVRVLRDKLARQKVLGLEGRALYTTYANLGTFLIHGNFPAAQKGDAKAKERLREGLGFIKQSIEVNPEAHFGREVWQAVVAEFLLAAMDDPQLLLKCDLAGDRLDRAVDPAPLRCINDGGLMVGRNREVAAYLKDPQLSIHSSHLRMGITEVGAEEGWDKAVRGSHTTPVPFDEPVLGIIGMWRLGGGANPHFALALGEIMLRVGQRYLAWCAYERAAGLEARFWPDPEIRRGLVAHCRARQALIESQLPAEERDRLRPRFEAELAFGQRYQKEYQDYEAERLAAGTSLDDPHFYDDFHARHAPIASPVGNADRILVTSGNRLLTRNPFAWVVFGAGFFALVAASLLRLWTPRPTHQPPPPRNAPPNPP